MRRTFTDYSRERDEKEEQKNDNKFRITWKLLAVSTAVVGGAYLMGGVKGLELGRKLGSKTGYLEGYAKAASDIAYIVKEAKETIDE
jgi:hypothetical protein